MATPVQIAANRRNAQNSTGPRTAEGKAAVRLNSLTHGLRTQDALWTSMQSVLDRVTPSDAANCFAHCGYSLRKG